MGSNTLPVEGQEASPLGLIVTMAAAHLQPVLDDQQGVGHKCGSNLGQR